VTTAARVLAGRQEPNEAQIGYSAGVTARQFFNDFNVSWNVF
jgi:hypothetical protein